MRGSGGGIDAFVRNVIFACRISQPQQQVAMISEMIHTASLIHDDVIDNSSTRRGKPTVDNKWGQRKVGHDQNCFFGCLRVVFIKKMVLEVGKNKLHVEI